MSETEIARLQRRLQRERAARNQAEQLLENKSRELFESNRQLLKLSRNLEQEVSERTLDLKVARDQALASAQAKTDFLANMSHEIRTPLNGVLGMLYAIKNAPDQAQTQTLISTAIESGQLLLSVINDILDFSKIESVGVALEHSEFSLHHCIEAVAHNFAPNAQARSLDLVTRIAPDLPKAFNGDSYRLQQVIGNFVSNAIKFTEKGHIEISVNYLGDGRVEIGVRDTGIGISEEQRQRIFNAFSQADNSVTRNYGGTGLGLSICGRIAQAMDTEIMAASEPGSGSTFSMTLQLEVIDPESLVDSTGTSLADKTVILITKCDFCRNVYQTWFEHIPVQQFATLGSLAELQERHLANAKQTHLFLDMGALDNAMLEPLRPLKAQYPGLKILNIATYDEIAHSHDMVDVQLLKPVRLAEALSVLSDRQETPIAKVAVSLETDSNRSLLIVDDNHLNHQVLASLLQPLGYQLSFSFNGEEAVARVQEKIFDLVFMDVQMPVMDGLSATRAIRRLGGEYQSIPIVAMTAHAQASDRNKSIAAGMDDHLTKPVDLDALNKILRKYLYASLSTSSTRRTMHFPDLQGFDLNRALRILGGDLTLFHRLFTDFQHQYQFATSSLIANIDGGNPKRAIELAHTIKGSGANLGADALSGVAGQIESDLKAGREITPAACEALDDELAKLSKALHLIDDKAQNKKTATPGIKQPPPRAISRAELSAALAEVSARLNNDIAEAETRLRALHEEHTQSEYGALLETLITHFNSFDLDDVADEISQFVNRG